MTAPAAAWNIALLAAAVGLAWVWDTWFPLLLLAFLEDGR